MIHQTVDGERIIDRTTYVDTKLLVIVKIKKRRDGWFVHSRWVLSTISVSRGIVGTTRATMSRGSISNEKHNYFKGFDGTGRGDTFFGVPMVFRWVVVGREGGGLCGNKVRRG